MGSLVSLTEETKAESPKTKDPRPGEGTTLQYRCVVDVGGWAYNGAKEKVKWQTRLNVNTAARSALHSDLRLFPTNSDNGSQPKSARRVGVCGCKSRRKLLITTVLIFQILTPRISCSTTSRDSCLVMRRN